MIPGFRKQRLAWYIYTNTSWKNKWRKEEWVEWRRVA